LDAAEPWSCFLSSIANLGADLEDNNDTLGNADEDNYAPWLAPRIWRAKWKPSRSNDSSFRNDFWNACHGVEFRGAYMTCCESARS
jgi:hypothetical protein